jgi:hypothetical protein
MLAYRATLPGKAKRSIPAFGRRRLKARAWVRRLNIDGDGQGDLAGHGGEHRAVLVYQHDSYRYWQNQLGRTGFAYGLHMRSDMVPAAIFPDYGLSDHTAKHRKLSELQEQHQMVLVLGRGGFFPKDRRQAEGFASTPS